MKPHSLISRAALLLSCLAFQAGAAATGAITSPPQMASATPALPAQKTTLPIQFSGIALPTQFTTQTIQFAGAAAFLPASFSTGSIQFHGALGSLPEFFQTPAIQFSGALPPATGLSPRSAPPVTAKPGALP